MTQRRHRAGKFIPEPPKEKNINGKVFHLYDIYPGKHNLKAKRDAVQMRGKGYLVRVIHIKDGNYQDSTAIYRRHGRKG